MKQQNLQPVELKIAYVGGGSRDWARKLMFDLALCSDLTGQVALYDIDSESARLNEQLGNWLQDQPGVVSHWRYAVVPTLKEALLGADFVVLSIQPGALEIMGEEIAIAEQHGMYFPVGDTTGAPGLVRGLRSATIYQEFARAIAAICPNAWVINYTNPMTICTRILTRVEPKLKVFGCCHEVFATQRMLASLVSQRLKVSPPPARDEIRINVSGINHFTLIDRAHYKDVDLLELVRQHIAEPGVLRAYTSKEVESWHDWFHSADQVKFELFQRWGILPAAGDRHLVEFLPGFTRSPEELFRWGVIRTPISYRIERWQGAPQKTRDLIAGRTALTLDTSGEESVAQIKALLGLGDLVTNVNVENAGQISNLPPRAVVETNARFSHDEVRPLAAGALPSALQSVVARHVSNQEMIVEAALTRDKELAFQAVYNDPANRLPVDESWEMFNQMLVASRTFLPGWDID
jgi:alpha-galactosidase/6-phospho-beta-glucosidase family protein